MTYYDLCDFDLELKHPKYLLASIAIGLIIEFSVIFSLGYPSS